MGSPRRGGKRKPRRVGNQWKSNKSTLIISSSSSPSHSLQNNTMFASFARSAAKAVPRYAYVFTFWNHNATTLCSSGYEIRRRTLGDGGVGSVWFGARSNGCRGDQRGLNCKSAGSRSSSLCILDLTHESRAPRSFLTIRVRQVNNLHWCHISVHHQWTLLAYRIDWPALTPLICKRHNNSHAFATTNTPFSLSSMQISPHNYFLFLFETGPPDAICPPDKSTPACPPPWPNSVTTSGSPIQEPTPSLPWLRLHVECRLLSSRIAVWRTPTLGSPLDVVRPWCAAGNKLPVCVLGDEEVLAREIGVILNEENIGD